MNTVVSIDYIHSIHSSLEYDKRCMKGIRDLNLLQSAIEGQQWFPDPVDQIIHVAYSICANHVYNDGNKRTAFLTLKLLETKLNYICYWPEIAEIILELAINSTQKDIFVQNIKDNILI